MFLPLADIFFLDLSALGDKILQPFFVTLFQRIPIVGQVFDEQIQVVQQVVPVVQEQQRPHGLIHGGNTGHILKAAAGKGKGIVHAEILDIGAGNHVRQLRGVGDHVVVPHRGRRHDLAESHLLCQFLDGIQRRLVCAVHRRYDQIGILKQVGDAGIIAVFLPACHGVRSHIAHAGFLAAVREITHHAPFQAAGVHQDRPCRDLRQRLLYHLHGDAVMQAENDHIVCAVCHGACAVDCAVCRSILAEFGLPGTSHIVNGHVPVQEKKGESPIKGGGRLVVIDGGFCRAYHEKTGIAGYTLVYSSRTMSLRTHQPFESAEKAVNENLDILSQKNILETENHRILVEETDEGEILREKVHDLKQLVRAYQLGWIKETRCDDSVW